VEKDKISWEVARSGKEREADEPCHGECSSKLLQVVFLEN
jgi:hypothetical protein